MTPTDKPLIWLHGELSTPPFSPTARLAAGFLLRKLPRGDQVSLPHARPMPALGPHGHERRIPDRTRTWRIIYRIDSDAVVIVEVFEKKTSRTPRQVMERCHQRLRRYDALSN